MKKFIGVILTMSILFSLSSEVLAFDISKVDATLEKKMGKFGNIPGLF